jgi:hypothetical protein
MKTTVDYITKLANIPSPTGYTSHIMNYVIAELESFGYAPVRTNKGGVMVTVTGKDDSKHRVVTAHLDTLGAMVRAVKPDGRLKMDLIGGFVYNAIEGENCTIHVAKNGKKISGTILMHQTSVHVYKDAGTAERNQANMACDLVPGLDDSILLASVYDYLWNTLELKFAGSYRHITAEKPDHYDKDYLACKDADPILQVEQVVYLENGRPIEYSRTRNRYDVRGYSLLDVKNS